MKASELQALTVSELRRELDDTKEELMKLRFQQASGQLEDTNRLRMVRRDVARIKTILTERQQEVENGE
ncbi:MAG: 50S ribosomal protein L29 [Anaerolineae bacterium]|nr:50S ribosomal protein L29 [Anaerolineae bacterium]